MTVNPRVARGAGAQTGRSRYSFVTITAWVFIVLGGLMALAGLVELAAVSTVVPPEKMRAFLEGSTRGQTNLPFYERFTYAHLREVLLVVEILLVGFVVSAIGLLRRRNWARLSVAGFLVLDIIWRIACQVMLVQVGGPMPAELPDAGKMPEQMQSVWSVVSTAAEVVSVISTVLISAVLGWVVWKLTSPKIIAEFVEPPEIVVLNAPIATTGEGRSEG